MIKSIVVIFLSIIYLGLCLIMAGGLNIGWTLFTSNFKTGRWVEEAIDIEILIVHVSIFIGMIVGGFNAGYFMDKIGRRNIYVSILSIKL